MNVTINDPSTIMAVNGRVTSNDLRIGTAIAIAMPTNAVKVRSSDWYASSNGHSLERRSHNGRFLRHRPERSGRCLNYENCTKAKARCQRAKVCPEGLSVKTMLSASEAALRFADVFAAV